MRLGKRIEAAQPRSAAGQTSEKDEYSWKAVSERGLSNSRNGQWFVPPEGGGGRRAGNSPSKTGFTAYPPTPVKHEARSGAEQREAVRPEREESRE